MTTFMHMAGATLLSLLAVAQAPAGDGQSALMDKAINRPGTRWVIYGDAQRNRDVKADGIPGGRAVQVTVTKKGEHPYDVGGYAPIQKRIAAGDAVLVAVYLRAPGLAAGETTPVGIGAAEAAAPYTPIVADTAQVGPEWKLYYASGKTPREFGPDTANTTVQLSADKHVVEMGPVLAFDFGPDQDMAKLPHN